MARHPVLFVSLCLLNASLPAQHQAVIFECHDRTSLADWVRCIYQDRRGFLWVGTVDRLVRFDGYTPVLYETEPGDTTSLSGYPVHCLYEDNTGMLWVGTSTGLNRFDRENNRFICHKQDTGAVRSDRDVVRAIREDDSGLLWISTSRGLYLFDKTQKQFQSFEEFFSLGDVIKRELLRTH